MKIGFAKESITPSVSYRMAGFDRRMDKSTGMHDELYVSCLAMISDAGEQTAFCVLDVLGTDKTMSERISSAVAADAVWVSATHTHAAPSAIFTGGQWCDPEYQAYVTDKCRIAAERAFSHAKNAVVSRALTKVCGIASVRNVSRGASDFEMPVAVWRFDCGDEVLRMVRYQCHPTVMNERNLLYSADLVYGARKTLPEGTLLMNGACADLSTRYTRRESSFAEAERLGALLTDAVNKAEYTEDPDFGKTISLRKQTLSLRRGASLNGEERDRLIRYFTEKIASCGDDNEKREYDSILCVLTGSVKAEEPDKQVTLTVADFGTMALTGLPFEVRHDDAQRIEKELTTYAGKPVLMAAYCGGYDGYLASGDPLGENSSYEDFSSRYMPETRERILNTLKQMIGG